MTPTGSIKTACCDLLAERSSRGGRICTRTRGPPRRVCCLRLMHTALLPQTRDEFADMCGRGDPALEAPSMEHILRVSTCLCQMPLT